MAFSQKKKTVLISKVIYHYTHKHTRIYDKQQELKDIEATPISSYMVLAGSEEAVFNPKNVKEEELPRPLLD